MSEENDESEKESVYRLLDAKEGMDHSAETDNSEDVREDFREEVFKRHLDLYQEAVSSLQEKIDSEFDENNVIILYGIYEEGATVAGVRPSPKEDEKLPLYVHEEWALDLVEQGISPSYQFERSVHEEELMDAINNMKIGLPEGLANRAERNAEDALEELENNPLTREVHGSYIFPGDSEARDYRTE